VDPRGWETQGCDHPTNGLQNLLPDSSGASNHTKINIKLHWGSLQCSPRPLSWRGGGLAAPVLKNSTPWFSSSGLKLRPSQPLSPKPLDQLLPPSNINFGLLPPVDIGTARLQVKSHPGQVVPALSQVVPSQVVRAPRSTRTHTYGNTCCIRLTSYVSCLHNHLLSVMSYCTSASSKRNFSICYHLLCPTY